MIVYPDTEKELFLTDYKPLPSLHGLSLGELEELSENLYAVSENAWLYGNDLLCMAIEQDIRKTDLYIRMAIKKQGKKG